MRIILASLFILAGLSQAQATEVLKNCYADDSAQFFASELEDISQDGATPVLLLNKKHQVVGVISVSPKRASSHPHQATQVKVNKLSLCAPGLEVDDFYYAEDDSSNLLNWTKADKGSLAITQDEGMITLEASVAKKLSYASLIKVDFKGYDVFREEEELEPSNNPDFIEDWGLPRGKGTFYFYLPKNWAL